MRAYSLPVGAFDHLKNLQRHLQRTIDPTGERHTVTNSEALTELLNDHYRLAADPIDMRAGADRLLARVVQVFGAAQAHHG
ncbi:transposase, partial [Hydrogenophaga intermedia]|uniref:transposase n=1 Tax=Hydrogenophaga intermedia TaxID=65786 RepID=UPI00110EE7E7